MKHGGTIMRVHTARLAKLPLDEKDISGEVSKGIHPSENGNVSDTIDTLGRDSGPKAVCTGSARIHPTDATLIQDVVRSDADASISSTPANLGTDKNQCSHGCRM